MLYYVLFWIVLFYVLFLSIALFYVLSVCKCVLYYCHRVSTQLQLNISYHIISYHIISYHITSYHIISYHIYTLYSPHKKFQDSNLYSNCLPKPSTSIHRLSNYLMAQFQHYCYRMQSKIGRIDFEYKVRMSVEKCARVGGCFCACLPFFLPSRL